VRRRTEWLKFLYHPHRIHTHTHTDTRYGSFFFQIQKLRQQNGRFHRLLGMVPFIKLFLNREFLTCYTSVLAMHNSCMLSHIISKTKKKKSHVLSISWDDRYIRRTWTFKISLFAIHKYPYYIGNSVVLDRDLHPFSKPRSSYNFQTKVSSSHETKRKRKRKIPSFFNFVLVHRSSLLYYTSVQNPQRSFFWDPRSMQSVQPGVVCHHLTSQTKHLRG